jgi:hypothetical protein
MREIMGWLFRAQDICGGEAIAEFYHLQTGWSEPCSETAVAMIPTFLSLNQRCANGESLARAIRLGVPEHAAPWLNDRSSAAATRIARIPTLAHTILAWTALYKHTHDPRFQTAAVDAAHRLVEHEQEAVLRQTATHSHRALSAWAILRATADNPTGSLAATALSCAESVARAIDRDGYLHNSFHAETFDPLLLRVARTLHALVEAGLSAGTRSWVDAALRGAQRLLELYRGHDAPGGRSGNRRPASHLFNCMAGCAQTAVLWLHLARQGLGDGFGDAAAHLNRFLASTIDTTNPDPGIRGGVRAGYPLWVDYYPLAYRALAAKFTLDAFLLEDEPVGGPRSVQKLQFKRPAEREYPAGITGGVE